MGVIDQFFKNSEQIKKSTFGLLLAAIQIAVLPSVRPTPMMSLQLLLLFRVSDSRSYARAKIGMRTIKKHQASFCMKSRPCLISITAAATKAAALVLYGTALSNSYLSPLKMIKRTFSGLDKSSRKKSKKVLGAIDTNVGTGAVIATGGSTKKSTANYLPLRNPIAAGTTLCFEKTTEKTTLLVGGDGENKKKKVCTICSGALLLSLSPRILTRSFLLRFYYVLYKQRSSLSTFCPTILWLRNTPVEPVLAPPTELVPLSFVPNVWLDEALKHPASATSTKHPTKATKPKRSAPVILWRRTTVKDEEKAALAPPGPMPTPLQPTSENCWVGKVKVPKRPTKVSEIYWVRNQIMAKEEALAPPEHVKPFHIVHNLWIGDLLELEDSCRFDQVLTSIAYCVGVVFLVAALTMFMMGSMASSNVVSCGLFGISMATAIHIFYPLETRSIFATMWLVDPVMSTVPELSEKDKIDRQRELDQTLKELQDAAKNTTVETAFKLIFVGVLLFYSAMVDTPSLVRLGAFTCGMVIIFHHYFEDDILWQPRFIRMLTKVISVDELVKVNTENEEKEKKMRLCQCFLVAVLHAMMLFVGGFFLFVGTALTEYLLYTAVNNGRIYVGAMIVGTILLIGSFCSSTVALAVYGIFTAVYIGPRFIYGIEK